LAVVAPAAQDKPAAVVPEFKNLDAFLKSLPAAKVTPLDPQSALLFTTLPLACVDDLQPKPAARPYFWQPTFKILESHDKTRAFYGCNDWQTAVNATWTMVTLLKRYPDLPVSGLIREKLTDHLGRQNLEGELAYFKIAGNFQRPYGYAWFLKLYAELATWKDPDGTRYAENAAPLARFLADSLVAYLIDLERPNRAAGQANSAFTLGLLLDYVDATRDMTIARAVRETAKRIFLTDTDCATDIEAVSPEIVSPCLAEAAVMSRVLDQTAFVGWFDKFLPAAQSTKFKPLRTVSLEAVAAGRGGRGRGAEAPAPADAQASGGRGVAATTSPRATWTGLAFTRADAFSRLAAALPAGDPRVVVFRRLAAIHAEIGQEGLGDPASFKAPWLGTFAVSYLMTMGSQR
jgi:hypothetical protein